MANKTYLALGALAVSSLVACQSSHGGRNGGVFSGEAKLFNEAPLSYEQGKASYYYGRWIGRKTANGETYQKDDVTAAHKTLPFGTYVRVHNLRNDRNMVVRINNRGPFVRGRVIDLSIRAADHLGMRQAGVVPVRIEVLNPILDNQSIERYVTEHQFASNSDSGSSVSSVSRSRRKKS